MLLMLHEIAMHANGYVCQVVLIFLVLAGYLTSQSWKEWRAEPVVTTLKHTAQPVTKVLKF